jgi:hypothetical protein
MKKKVLPLAVGAATAVTMSAAHAAMYVNENGLGENLIFPAYSVENGNNTLINIVNTTDGYKAVKVRMLEGQNSKEVLDFNLYLSPRDHFSFAISATADGGGMLTTGDNSCTVPAIPADGVAFVNYEYIGDKGADDADTAADESFDNTSVTRTAAGYVEVIEMGQLDPDATPVIDYAGIASTTVTAMNAAAAMKHDASGVPANCQILVDAWSTIADVPGQWLGEATNNADTATYGTEPKKIGHSEFMTTWSGGGLYGYGVMINVPQGAAIGYDAVAVDEAVIAGDLTSAPAGSAMHYEPGDKQPNFSDTSFDTNALVISDVDGTSAALDFAAYGAGVAQLQALNATIMTTEIYNDYVTDPVIAATTDWVMTMPTKAFHLAAYSRATGSESNVIEPFSETWTGQTACEPSRIDLVNREESAVYVPPTSDQPIFSPAPPVEPGTPTNGDILLCYESSVLQFAETTAMGTSSLATGINALLQDADGWATLTLAQPAELDTVLNPCDGIVNGAYSATKTAECERKIQGGNGTILDGLPIVGFAVQKYVNGAAGGAGVLANYGAAVEHKTYTKQS